MNNDNVAFYSSRVITETIWGVVYFPLWWYGQGLVKFVLILANFVHEREQGLGFWVWLKNIGRPMYGQRDVAGVLISLAMRLIQIAVRGLALLFWLVLAFACLLFWLALPPLVLYQLAYQIIPTV